MEKKQAELYDILIQCLKKDIRRPDENTIAALTPQDWHNLLALADMQRITPLLWHRIRQKNLETLVPETTAADFREAFHRNTLINLRFNGDLARLLDALKKKNIPLILLKGIALSNIVYENISLREMNDIDLLAKPEHLEHISDTLIEMGFRPLQASAMSQATHHLPRFLAKGHGGFEIHWDITRPDTHYSIEPHGLRQRTAPVRVAGRDTLMLSAEDMLLHLCLHTSYHHPFVFGLRPFYDIAETIDHFGSVLDWQIVANRAVSQKWQRGVYLALCLAVELAGASVPDFVIRNLRPPDMSETILETARNQIFTDKYFATTISEPLARLLGSRRFADKINIFRQRIFLPKEVIAKIYAVPKDSLKIYGCYVRRFFDLLHRHGGAFKKYQGNDAPLKKLVERKNLIGTWLAQPTALSGNREQSHKD
jgi:hypothetical protein